MTSRKIFEMLSKKKKSRNESMLRKHIQKMLTIGRQVRSSKTIEFIVDEIHQKFLAKIVFYYAKNIDE